MMDKYISIVPINVANDISAGTILEYDATNHVYQPLSSGTPAGILLEDVTAGQVPAKAKVLFFGIVYEDELASAPSEDLKAQLRQVGVFVEPRTNV